MNTNFFEFYLNHFGQSWRSYLWMGILFILGGLIILFFPQILIILLATMFFIIGIFIISVAIQIKRMKPDDQEIIIDLFN